MDKQELTRSVHALIDHYKTSGETVHNFYHRERINEWQFYCHKRKKATTAAPAQQSRFIQINRTPAIDKEVSLGLPGGLMVSIEGF
ncbi:MAG TPA: hypothetical protein PK239_16795 [Chitinophagales bacterium]|nr:hypothetical protein [Chitinophagales bacterium]HRK28933.1 hypothetical protein [Chitinophagales bacterium]